jgi:hypothetical protein
MVIVWWISEQKSLGPSQSGQSKKNPLKNVWWQHLKILMGRPIEIVWVWAPTKNFIVLMPITID